VVPSLPISSYCRATIETMIEESRAFAVALIGCFYQGLDMMLGPHRPPGFRLMLFGFVLFSLSACLAACSEKSQSLADYVASICATHFRAGSQEEAPFLAENISAMTKMMVDMGINPSGDIDRDFVSMMAPHHQGAIDMAEAELRYGHNELLRRMAQEIVVTQQQEIAAMRLALDQPLSSSEPSRDQVSSIRRPDANPERQ
jgi:hypothetical protein